MFRMLAHLAFTRWDDKMTCKDMQGHAFLEFWTSNMKLRITTFPTFLKTNGWAQVKNFKQVHEM